MYSKTYIQNKYKIVTEVERSSIQQQNKWYSQRCLLAHFETTLDFSSIEFTCTYIITFGYVIKGK